jgi:hypothetical protein
MKTFQKIMLAMVLFPGLALSQQSAQPGDAPGASAAQVSGGADDSQAAQQKMGPGMVMESSSFIESITNHSSSGTSAEPDSTPIPMFMTAVGKWMVMFHANAFIVDEQQSSPRGRDAFFSTNWFMPMAQRKLGPGTLTLRTMLSLEPATITGRQYPLLFQQGETAFGLPIADGQHPHNFFMEVAALYDMKLGANTLLSFYAAPVGDPAIGPTAYPHRASAFENPVAALGHHQEDSTHISDDVVTLGLTYRIARIEASGFHGREPNEHRWGIHQGRIDSWSTRLTFQPGRNWSGQYSYARITSPEALFPNENQERMTTSLMYNRPIRGGNWANTMVWGRTRSLLDGAIFNSYLLESTLDFRARNHVWTRMENVERSNELILGENPLPPNFQEMPIGDVQAYTFGYDRDFHFIPGLAIAPGAQFTVYGVPDILRPIYGSHPAGVAMFLRFRPSAGRH